MVIHIHLQRQHHFVVFPLNENIRFLVNVTQEYKEQDEREEEPLVRLDILYVVVEFHLVRVTKLVNIILQRLTC